MYEIHNMTPDFPVFFHMDRIEEYITFCPHWHENLEILNVIEDRKQRRLMAQPLEYPSAGSVFRNPEGNFAGKLIEDIGYKGKNIGGAKKKKKHANFIINEKNATGKEIVKLIEEIKINISVDEYGDVSTYAQML